MFVSDTVDEDDDLYDCVEDEEDEGDEIYEDLMRTEEPPETVSKQIQQQKNYGDMESFSSQSSMCAVARIQISCTYRDHHIILGFRASCTCLNSSSTAIRVSVLLFSVQR